VLRRTVPPGVEVYEINRPFSFGAAEKFKETITRMHRMPRVLIIRIRNVPAVDSTGPNALRDVVFLVRRAHGSFCPMSTRSRWSRSGGRPWVVCWRTRTWRATSTMRSISLGPAWASPPPPAPISLFRPWRARSGAGTPDPLPEAR